MANMVVLKIGKCKLQTLKFVEIVEKTLLMNFFSIGQITEMPKRTSTCEKHKAVKCT